MPSAQTYVHLGPESRTFEFPPDKNYFSIGRDDHNDIVLDQDQAVSSSHAVLRRLGWHWTIEDLQSKNGVYVLSPDQHDQIRVHNMVPLLLGQSLRLGRSLLTVSHSPNGTHSAVPKPAPTSSRKPHEQTTLSVRKEGEALVFEMPVEGAFATCYSVPFSHKDISDAIETYHARCAQSNGNSVDHAANALAELSHFLRRSLLPKRIGEKLDALDRCALRLVIDAPLLDIPWELVQCKESCLSLAHALGRQVRVEGVVSAVAKRTEIDRPRVFLLANPTGDLPEVSENMEHLFRLIERAKPNSEVDYLSEERIRRYDVLQRLNNYDVIIYTGHADNGSVDARHSGWRLSDGHITPSDLRVVSSPPRFVFANGCATDNGASWTQRLPVASAELAVTHALVLAGSAHVVGTAWPVSAPGAIALGQAFFAFALQGWDPGETMQFARQHVRANGDANAAAAWPAYVLYGEPAGPALFPAADPFEST